MSEFSFTSPGAAASAALFKFLADREAQARRAMLDRLDVQRADDARVERARLADRQRAQDQRQQRLDTAAQADRLARIYAPDTELPADAVETLTAGGYDVQRRTTLPARTLTASTSVPGVDDGAPPAPAVPGLMLPQHDYRTRGETVAERQTREQIAREQAERDENRRWRDEQARTAAAERLGAARAQMEARADEAQRDRIFRGEQAAASRDLQRTIAEGSASIRRDAAQTKADEKAAAAKQARDVAVQGFVDIHDLADAIKNDALKSSQIGAFDSRVPDWMLTPGAVDFRRRVERLRNLLALGERAKLKGQGAISDRETDMLAKAVTSLSLGGSVDAFDQELDRIMAGAQRAVGSLTSAGSRSGDVVRWGRDASGRPVRLH